MGWLIVLLIVLIITYIVIMIVRADKKVSPEKYSAPKPTVNEKGELVCPYCGSTQIQIVKQGHNPIWGWLFSNENERVCLHCMKKF